MLLLIDCKDLIEAKYKKKIRSPKHTQDTVNVDSTSSLLPNDNVQSNSKNSQVSFG